MKIVAFLLLTVLVLALMSNKSQVAIFALDSNRSTLSFVSKCEKFRIHEFRECRNYNETNFHSYISFSIK